MEPITATMILKPIVEGFISKVVVPKLQDFTKKIKLEYDKKLVPRGEHFTEYILRTYEKFSIINTLARKNSQMSLKDIYIPLTLSVENKAQTDEYLLDGYSNTLVEKYKNKVLIVDSAGMGKSTVTKRMFLDIIDNGYGIPIYIELRRLNKEHSILDEICNQLNSISKSFDVDLLLELFQMGGFIFFLDGYDEISLNQRDVVTNSLQDFIEKIGRNKFIMTSRPENALSSFGGFKKTSINPLTKDEAYLLLSKYDNDGEISQSLIKNLKSGEYPMIDDFLENPLLVSLLFVAYDFKQTIPLKKHIFYRQVFDAHFENHDLAKGGGFIHEKKCGLDIDDFERVLRFVGFQSLRLQKIEYSKDELLKVLAQAKRYCVGITFKESNFFDDLLSTVPLFHQDGNYYKWAHRSLLEYFAAEYIYKDAKDNQDKILDSIYNNKDLDNYYNLLDLYYDIDIYGFRKNILLPFLKEYREQLGQKEDDNELNIQRGLLYCKKVYLLVSSDEILYDDLCEILTENDPSFKIEKVRRYGHKNYLLHYCIQFSERVSTRMILRLLLNKQTGLVSYYRRSRYMLDEQPLPLEKMTPYLVKATKDSFLCRAKLTKQINNVLAGHVYYWERLYISHDACINEIKKIEAEVERQSQSSDILF